MIAPQRRRRTATATAAGSTSAEPRAKWRPTAQRIAAFKLSPPGTSSADFNRGATS
jgi:hypothetical protein